MINGSANSQDELGNVHHICLELIESGEETIESLLGRYPEIKDLLRPPLEAASSATSAAPSPAPWRRSAASSSCAGHGTLFLDGIGDMSLDTQAKLLRVLEENEMERVGGTETIPLDVRVVAATNKDLAKEIGRSTFREDLYFRLAVITIRVPPLRDRGPDIATLAQHFLGRYCEENGRRPKNLTPAARALLSQYSWPGNVRELRNMMERVVIMVDDDEIDSPRSSIVPAPIGSTPIRTCGLQNRWPWAWPACSPSGTMRK